MHGRFPRLGRMATATVAVALAGAALTIDPEAGGAPVKAAVAEQATPAAVARVEKRPINKWSDFSGRLEAVDRVEIRPRVAGEIVATHFREGAEVQRGDVLFTIDRAPYAAAADRARAEVAAAEARLKLARADLERGRKMTSLAISGRDLDQRDSEVRSAAAAKQSAEAQFRSAELNLGYTEVRAPIAGRVGRIEITAGNLVAAGPGAPVLTQLVSVDPIYASFDADEQTVLNALDTLPQGVTRSDAIGLIPVEMSTSTRQAAARGRLQYVAPSVQAAAGTIRVRAEFPNPDGRLFPGQFARLKLGEAREYDAVLVSERAIGVDQDKNFVLVVGEDDRATYRQVRLGASSDGLKVVLSGLADGERVVVEGLQKLKSGALVAPEPVAMNGSPIDQRQASSK
jgi:multidrug efflux system membrane fusion protein